MNDSQLLAKQIDRALRGDAWHGPSWKEILEGVTSDAADRRPIPSAHTIAEIVRHVTTWNDVVRRRLGGEIPEVPDDQDWPMPAEGETWPDLAARLLDRGAALRDAVETFPPDRLREARSGPAEGTWLDLILGQLQHLTCHAGQVAILKKGV